jgi:hypothetical protein
MGAAALSKLRAEDDPQDPLDLAEAMLIEGERDFDRAIFRPVDLKQKPLWVKLDQEHSWTALRFLARL